MAKILHLTIPEPCHVDWNKMTPNEQGAFCQSCQKTVVDFTGKSNQQIYDTFAYAEGNICGRFHKYQIAEPITKFEVKESWLNWKAIAASLAALITAERSVALMKQNPLNAIVQTSYADTITLPEQTKKDSILTKSAYKTIRGKIVDATTMEPLASASVFIKNENRGTSTDLEGNFELLFYTPESYDTAKISCMYVGFTSKEVNAIDVAIDSIISLEPAIIKGEIIMVVGMAICEPREVPSDMKYSPERLLDRYDPKLDIRKKVRDKAKGK